LKKLEKENNTDDRELKKGSGRGKGLLFEGKKGLPTTKKKGRFQGEEKTRVTTWSKRKKRVNLVHWGNIEGGSSGPSGRGAEARQVGQKNFN